MKTFNLLSITIALMCIQSLQAQNIEINTEKYKGALGINLVFNYTDLTDEGVMYYKIGLGYNLIDKKYDLKKYDYFGFEIDAEQPKIDYINLFMTAGLHFNNILNLPPTIDVRTGVRANMFQGLFAEAEGVFLLKNDFGVLVKGGYRIGNLITIEETATALGAFDGVFFGAGIVF